MPNFVKQNILINAKPIKKESSKISNVKNMYCDQYVNTNAVDVESTVVPKFPKFPNFVRSLSIVFIEILLIFDNLSYFGVFFKKKKTLKFWEFFLFVNKLRMNKH